MRKALVLTIGTEITSGEIVNTNASWVATQVEDAGVRVYSHLTVRDERSEIETALNWAKGYDLILVTGGLGPTSDDLTRECVAKHIGKQLLFDDAVWAEMSRLYQVRGLPLREAHRHQCWFPEGAQKLSNPVGSALGFACTHERRLYVVLPGPPRELQSMWAAHVPALLKGQVGTQNRQWIRWTCLGAPESEVAELVEPVLSGRQIEVGYRAQVPYVKVKIFADPKEDRDLIEGLEKALKPYIVARGLDDVAELLLKRWPAQTLQIRDDVTHGLLFERVLKAARTVKPELKLSLGTEDPSGPGLGLYAAAGESFRCLVQTPSGRSETTQELPYKIKRASERGQRTATEWCLWQALQFLTVK